MGCRSWPEGLRKLPRGNTAGVRGCCSLRAKLSNPKEGRVDRQQRSPARGPCMGKCASAHAWTSAHGPRMDKCALVQPLSVCRRSCLSGWTSPTVGVGVTYAVAVTTTTEPRASMPHALEYLRRGRSGECGIYAAAGNSGGGDSCSNDDVTGAAVGMAYFEMPTRRFVLFSCKETTWRVK